MADLINLNGEAPEGLSLVGDETTAIRDERTIRSLVDKADFALADHTPGRDELDQSYRLGFDKRIQEQAALASAIDARRNWQARSLEIIKMASDQGRVMSDLERSYVLDRPTEDVTNERVALEERYASRLVNTVVQDDREMFPEATEEARSIVTKQQIASKLLADMQEKAKNQSWVSWGADFAKSIVPGYSWAKQSNQLEGIKTSKILPGANVAEQMRGLYSLPADQFEAVLSEAIADLAADNIIEARDFAQAAVSFSTSQELTANFFAMMDAADIATLGATTAAAKIAKGFTKETAKKAITDTLEEAANPNITSIDRQVLSGQAEQAAHEAVRDRLGEIGLATNVNPPFKNRPTEILNDLSKTGMGMVDPNEVLRGAGSLTNERQRRLLDYLQTNWSRLTSSLTDITHIVRISDEAAARGFVEAEAEFRRINTKLEDAIIEVRPVRESVDVFGGTDYIEVLIGRKEAQPFASPKQAENYANNVYRLPKGAWSVFQKGNSFYLRMEKRIREDSLDVLDLRLSTDNTAPVNLQNRFLSWVRNPDDLRSKQSSAAAKQGTYGANAVMERMSEVAKDIGSLGKNEVDRLRSVMDDARFQTRTIVDPKTGKNKQVSGVFYHTVADFEKAYAAKGYPLPTQKEIQAYFSFRQLSDFDYAVKNISVYRDKARLGIDQKSIGWVYVDETGKKQYKHSEFFEGRTIPHLPNRSGETFTIGWYNGKTGKTNFMTSDTAGARGKWAEIDELTDQGYKIIQVANPNDESLKAFIDTKGEPLQYLIVRDIKEKPLAMRQVEYNEGGHWLYPESGSYIKQPRVHKTGFGRRIYDGDTSVHWIANPADAKKLADSYSTAGRMYLLQDPNFDTFVQTNLPYTGPELAKLFKEKALDPSSPFLPTEHGKTVTDYIDLKDYFRDRNIVDAGKSEHSVLSKINTQYTQERGERLTTVSALGTQANPVYSLKGAPVMDPMAALARSSTTLARSRFFDDYKHKVVEDFGTQFADIIDAPKQEVLADPLRFMREPKFKAGADPNAVSAAKSQRRSLLYLLGQDDQDMGVMKWFRQKMVNSVGIDGKVIDPVWWGAQTDPSTIARSAVFHMKLGLFNLVQYPLQAQAITHVAALDGSLTRAAQANSLFWSMRMRQLASTNKGAQSFFGKAVSKAVGLDQKTVDEAYTAWQTSGMNVFEGEYARLDDYLNPKSLYGGGAVKKGLDVASLAFREGNMTHRGVAFTTAFLRWRQMNPTKKLDAQEMNKIIERADLYYINMSRASNNAMLASGPVSIPAQFTTFTKNLTEQLLPKNKRLSGWEKARLFGMYSTLYGLPVGIGLQGGAAALWPVSESIRQYALEQGYDGNSSALENFIINGAAGAFTQMLSDTDYNASERYGPGGLTWFRDILDGAFFETVSGASGSSIAETMERFEPFWYATASVFSDNDYYDLTANDFIDAAREVSSLNNAMKAYYLVKTNEFMTRTDKVLMKYEPDVLDTIMVGVFGLSPQDVSDAYLQLRSNRDAQKSKAEMIKVIQREFTRGLKASADGDRKMAETFYKRAHALVQIADFTPTERADVWQKAVRDNRALVDVVDRQFMIKDPEKRFNPYVQRRLQQGE